MPESASRGIFKTAQAAAKELGRSVHGEHVGYASDANTLWKTGMSTLVGLGPYGGGMHTDQEFMDTRSYEERLKLSLKILERL